MKFEGEPVRDRVTGSKDSASSSTGKRIVCYLVLGWLLKRDLCWKYDTSEVMCLGPLLISGVVLCLYFCLIALERNTSTKKRKSKAPQIFSQTP